MFTEKKTRNKPSVKTLKILQIMHTKQGIYDCKKISLRRIAAKYGVSLTTVWKAKQMYQNNSSETVQIKWFRD